MRRTQVYLSLLGCVCSLTGALLLAAASIPMLSSLQREAQLARDNAIYVDVDTCFTCHEDQQLGWSHPLQPRAIEDVVVNPHAVTMNLSSPEDALPIGADGDRLAIQPLDVSVEFPSAYRFADSYPASLSLSGSPEEQLP